jgi:hypothetical protein
MAARDKTCGRRGCPLLLLCGLAAGIVWLTGFCALAQTPANGTQKRDVAPSHVHILPVQGNVSEFATKYSLPQEAARGGAETMYPEYQKKLRALMSSTASKP